VAGIKAAPNWLKKTGLTGPHLQGACTLRQDCEGKCARLCLSHRLFASAFRLAKVLQPKRPTMDIYSGQTSREHIQFLSELLPKDPFLKLLLIAPVKSYEKATCVSATEDNALIGVLLIGTGWNITEVLLASFLMDPFSTIIICLSPLAIQSGVAALGQPRGFSVPSELLYLAVSKSFRGKHIARNLMSWAIEHAILEPKAWVRTLITNHSALKAYLGVGFEARYQRFGRSYLQLRQTGDG